MHYLDVPSKKPRALAGSDALDQWRAQGRWPESFDRLWEELKKRRGKQDGPRSMIDLLLLGRAHRLGAVIPAQTADFDLRQHASGSRYLRRPLSIR
jgi:hypothetical protein